MRVKVVLSYKGKSFGGEVDLVPIESSGSEPSVSKERKVSKIPSRPSELLEQLYSSKFFAGPRTLGETRKELERRGYHFGASSIFTALEAAEFLQKRGVKRSFTFVQKVPPVESSG